MRPLRDDEPIKTGDLVASGDLWDWKVHQRSGSRDLVVLVDADPVTPADIYDLTREHVELFREESK